MNFKQLTLKKKKIKINHYYKAKDKTLVIIMAKIISISKDISPQILTQLTLILIPCKQLIKLEFNKIIIFNLAQDRIRI